jgi:hypothetical protein
MKKDYPLMKYRLNILRKPEIIWWYKVNKNQECQRKNKQDKEIRKQI